MTRQKIGIKTEEVQATALEVMQEFERKFPLLPKHGKARFLAVLGNKALAVMEAVERERPKDEAAFLSLIVACLESGDLKKITKALDGDILRFSNGIANSINEMEGVQKHINVCIFSILSLGVILSDGDEMELKGSLESNEGKFICSAVNGYLMAVKTFDKRLFELELQGLINMFSFLQAAYRTKEENADLIKRHQDKKRAHEAPETVQ